MLDTVKLLNDKILRLKYFRSSHIYSSFLQNFGLILFEDIVVLTQILLIVIDTFL